LQFSRRGFAELPAADCTAGSTELRFYACGSICCGSVVQQAVQRNPQRIEQAEFGAISDDDGAICSRTEQMSSIAEHEHDGVAGQHGRASLIGDAAPGSTRRLCRTSTPAALFALSGARNARSSATLTADDRRTGQSASESPQVSDVM